MEAQQQHHQQLRVFYSAVLKTPLGASSRLIFFSGVLKPFLGAFGKLIFLRWKPPASRNKLKLHLGVSSKLLSSVENFQQAHSSHNLIWEFLGDSLGGTLGPLSGRFFVFVAGPVVGLQLVSVDPKN